MSEFNRGRAQTYYNMLAGNKTNSEWIVLFAQILAFLLVCIIDGDTNEKV